MVPFTPGRQTARAGTSPFRAASTSPGPDEADVAAALEEIARDLERRWPDVPPDESAASPKMALLHGAFVASGLLMGTSAQSPSDRVMGWANVLFFGAGLLISLGLSGSIAPGALGAGRVRRRARTILGALVTLGAMDGALWLLAVGESGFGWPLRLACGAFAVALAVAVVLRLWAALARTAPARARFVLTSRGLVERRRALAVLYPVPSGRGAEAHPSGSGELGFRFGAGDAPAPFALRFHGPVPERRRLRAIARHARLLARTRRRSGFDLVVPERRLHVTGEAHGVLPSGRDA